MSGMKREETTKTKGHSSMIEIVISMKDIFDYPSALTDALACIKLHINIIYLAE